MRNATCEMLHAKCYMRNATCEMLHAKCYASYFCVVGAKPILVISCCPKSRFWILAKLLNYIYCQYVVPIKH